MPNDFKLEVGHRFTFQSVPLPTVKFGGTAYCEVLDFEAEETCASNGSKLPIANTRCCSSARGGTIWDEGTPSASLLDDHLI
jgi:hypothetical protein